jgi:hypothetical protein
MSAAKMIRFNKSAQDGWLQEQLFLQRSFVAALSQTAPFLISRLRVNRSLREIARYNLQEYLSLEKVSDKNKQRIRIGKRVKQESIDHRRGGPTNHIFIPEAIVGIMFASLTLSSRRLS